MTLPADVDFQYQLLGHGWSAIRLSVDKHVHEFVVTHVFNDPVEELLNASIDLAKGREAARIQWSDEPGAYLLTFRALPAERHLLEVTVTEHSTIHLEATDSTVVGQFSFIVVRRFWLHLVWSEVRKLAASLSFRHYAAERDKGTFPWDSFNEYRVLMS